MPIRLRAADQIEQEKAEYIQLLKKYPVEISAGVESTPGYFRVVLQKPEELDILIAQLRAPSVSAEEALNGSLVR